MVRQKNPFTSENYILHAKSHRHYWNGYSSLSIKTFSNGQAFYNANHGFFAVEEQRYLLLNEGHYTINIESETEVESFCLFFKHGFAEEVNRSMIAASGRLLNDPYTPSTSVEFFEKTYLSDKILNLLLNRLRKQHHWSGQDPLWKGEQFHGIMQAILGVHRNVLAEVHSLPALRISTREEIYRRISVAYDYIQAYFNRSITLDEIASIACMSPNHLLRNYKIVYGQTPYQHITENSKKGDFGKETPPIFG